MTRKALGRGLGALLSADRPSSFGDEQYEVEVDLIDASPLQPRTHFDQASLEQLAQSIDAHGVVQPVVLRPRADATNWSQEKGGGELQRWLDLVASRLSFAIFKTRTY